MGIMHCVIKVSVQSFKIIKVFKEWNDRGIDGYEFSENVIRVCNNNKRNLHGFFVAVFERNKSEKSKKRKLSAQIGETVKKRKLNPTKWRVKVGLNSKQTRKWTQK